MARNLVIICAGQDSLHQRWKQLCTDHGFDLALLVYDGAVYHDHNSEHARWVMHRAARKFDNIHHFLTTQDWSEYDQVGIVDDDMLTSPADIGRIFDLGRRHEFDLYAPSLAPGSYVSHAVTQCRPEYDFRISNVVEIMCPFWSRRALLHCLPDFIDGPNKQGYGLEYSWEALLASHAGKTKFGGWVAMIDRHPMVHTKPVVARPEVSEPDTWHFRRKYNVDHLWVFNEQVIKGYHSDV